MDPSPIFDQVMLGPVHSGLVLTLQLDRNFTRAVGQGTLAYSVDEESFEDGAEGANYGERR